jgi:hypothetical protein
MGASSSFSGFDYRDYCRHFSLLSPVSLRLSHSQAESVWDEWINSHSHSDSDGSQSHSLDDLFDLSVDSLSSLLFDLNLLHLHSLSSSLHSSDPDVRSSAALALFPDHTTINTRIAQLNKHRKKLEFACLNQLKQGKVHRIFLQALNLHSTKDKPSKKRVIEILTKGGKLYSSGSFHWRVNHSGSDCYEYELLQAAMKLQAANSEKFHHLAEESKEHVSVSKQTSKSNLFYHKGADLTARRDLLEHIMMVYELCLDEFKVEFYAKLFKEMEGKNQTNEEKPEQSKTSPNDSPLSSRSSHAFFSLTSNKSKSSSESFACLNVPNSVFLPLSQLSSFLSMLYLPAYKEVESYTKHWKTLKHTGINVKQFIDAFQQQLSKEQFDRLKPLLLYKFYAIARKVTEQTTSHPSNPNSVVSAGVQSIERDPHLLEQILTFGPGQMKIHEWRTRNFPTWSRQNLKRNKNQSHSAPDSPVNSSPTKYSNDSVSSLEKNPIWLVNYAILWESSLHQAVCDNRIRRKSRQLDVHLFDSQTLNDQQAQENESAQVSPALIRQGSHYESLDKDIRIPYSYAKLLARFHIPCPEKYFETIKQWLENIARLDSNNKLKQENNGKSNEQANNDGVNSLSSSCFNVFEFLEVVEQHPDSEVYEALSSQYSQQFAASDDKAKRQNVAFQQWKADESAAVDSIRAVLG